MRPESDFDTGILVIVMSEFGKKITIFLVDGNPDGRQTCEIFRASHYESRAAPNLSVFLKDLAEPAVTVGGRILGAVFLPEYLQRHPHLFQTAAVFRKTSRQSLHSTSHLGSGRLVSDCSM